MAETKKGKGTTSKKAEVKEVKQEPVETIVEEVKLPEEQEENVTVEEVESAIEKVDVEIPVEEITEEKSEQEESFEEQINEIVDKVDEIQKSKDEFNDNIAKHPEQAEELIKEELQKAEAMKASVKKIIKSVDNAGFTSTWNGMNYDF